MVWPASRGWRARAPVNRSTPSSAIKPTYDALTTAGIASDEDGRKRRKGGRSKALDSANLSQNSYGSCVTNLKQNKKSERGDPVQITYIYIYITKHSKQRVSWPQAGPACMRPLSMVDSLCLLATGSPNPATYGTGYYAPSDSGVTLCSCFRGSLARSLRMA